jgi:hypothetical protein
VLIHNVVLSEQTRVRLACVAQHVEVLNPMPRALLSLAATAAFVRTAAGCPFALSGGPMPADETHRRYTDRRQLRASAATQQQAPDGVVPDVAGGRFAIPGGGITVPRPGYGTQTTVDVMDAMAKKSVAAGTGPLCYWSWQSLPPPTDPVHNPQWGARGKFDFGAVEANHPGSIAAIRDLCTYAVDRLQQYVDPIGHSGVNVLAAVTEGTEFATYLCRQGLHLDKQAQPARCAAGSPLYNQSWGLRWPMSVTMWMLNGTNKAEVTATMKRWREQPSGHLPNILSPAPAPGPGNQPVHIPAPLPAPPVPAGGGVVPHAGTAWGPGGGVVAKALPCNAISKVFKYQPPFPQDTSPPGYTSPAGQTFLDDALQYWSNTLGYPMPDSQCTAREKALCGAARAKSVVACEVCGAAHVGALTKAGCTTGDVVFFCTP